MADDEDKRFNKIIHLQDDLDEVSFTGTKPDVIMLEQTKIS
jgi:hypothetical protein